jgi:Spy/CpxP family protein refolding chaperone
MTDRLISRINATPEQAQVLRIEVGEFLKYARGLRSELGGYRTDIAEAMKADSFDATIMGESFGRQDDQLRELRERLVGSLARIHDVLEPEQREMVSELLEHGPRFGGRRRGW